LAIRVVFAILAIGFFAAPVTARVLGVSAESFENRRLAHPPRLSQGWDAFAQTTRYLTDRMPLRAQAVRANTQIWTDVFGTDPVYTRDDTLADDGALPFAGAIEQASKPDGAGAGPQGPVSVTTGSAHWSFLSEEFEVACDRKVSNAQVLRRWAGLVRALRASGRDSLFVAAPSKASVYPEHLPDEYPFDHCALAAKDRLWRMLARQGPRLGVHELRSELVRRKATHGDGLFQTGDSHWSTLGALVMVDVVLAEIGDDVRLQPQDVVARGSTSYKGDLSVVGGSSETDVRREYDVVRPADAPRLPGRTLVIGDSFAYRWIRLFKPYFESVRYVRWYDSAAWIADAVQRSDRVIVEANEFMLKMHVGPRSRPATLTRMLSAGRI